MATEEGGYVEMEEAPYEDTDKTQKREQEPPGTVVGTYFNIIKNVIGAGILPLPFAIRILGWFGFFLLFAVLALVNISVYAIIHSMAMVRTRDNCPLPTHYAAITEAAFRSKAWGMFAEIVLLVYTLGTLTAYQLLIPQFIIPVVEEFNAHPPAFLLQEGFWIIVASCVMFPISTFKTLQALRYTSLFGVSVIFFLTVVTVYTSLTTHPAKITEIEFAEGGLQMFKAIGTLLFCYSFHMNAPRYYAELGHRTEKKYQGIVGAAYLTITTLFLLVIICGLNAYGLGIEDNLLKSFPNKPIYAVLRCFLAAMIMCTYPLICFQTRTSTITVLCLLTKKERPAWEDPLLFRVIIAGCIVVTTGFVGWVAPSISVVLGFLGAVVGSMQLMILPGLWVVMLHKEEHGWNPSRFNSHSWLGIMLLLLGTVAMVLGVTGTIISLTKKQ